VIRIMLQFALAWGKAVDHERINFVFNEFIMLNMNALQFDYVSNICECLSHVACQVSRRRATASTGVRVFGSVIEVMHLRRCRSRVRA
jgi:hypothetical protein